MALERTFAVNVLSIGVGIALVGCAFAIELAVNTHVRAVSSAVQDETGDPVRDLAEASEVLQPGDGRVLIEVLPTSTEDEWATLGEHRRCLYGSQIP